MTITHCWHETGNNTGEDRAEICCYCGAVYDPTKRVPFAGHGKYAPDTMRPLRPSGPCAERIAAEQQQIGKAIDHIRSTFNTTGARP